MERFSQHAGDGGAGVPHFVHVDAQGVGRLGILTAGPQAQSKPGFVEQDGQHNEQQDAHLGGQIHLVELEGIMIFGAFIGVLFVRVMQGTALFNLVL